MKANRRAFLKRKACVMKKTMELSILCGINACAVIVDADGSVETWPNNPTDLKQILDQYKQKHSSNKKQSNNVKDVLSKLNSKIEDVKRRIEFLKGKSITNCVGDGNGGKQEFSEILRDIIEGSAATVNVQEIGPTDEQTCPLDYYWDGHIGLSDNSYATANYVQQVEQPCPEPAYMDLGDNGLLQNHSADFDLFWSDILHPEKMYFHC